jgi:hypothetical protein
MIALGFGTAWAVLMVWGFDTAKDFFGPEWSNEYLELRMDGTPVVAISTGMYTNNRTYRTLEGAPLSISSGEAWLQGTYLETPKDRTSRYLCRNPLFDRSGWMGRIRAFNSGGQPMTYWYFIVEAPPRESGYFVAFDSASKRRVGYIGRGGFQAQPPAPEECFPVHHHPNAWSAAVGNCYTPEGDEPFMPPYSQGSGRFQPWVVYVLTDDGVTEVDLLKRSTRVVLNGTGLTAAGHVNRGLPSPVTVDSDAYRSKVREFLVVRGENQILVLDSSGQRQSSFAIPAELRDSNFSFHLLNGSMAVIQPHGDQLLRIDTTGKILRRTDYVMKHGFVEPEFPPWRVTLSVPTPLAVATVSAVAAPSYYLWIGKDTTYLGALNRSGRDFWPAMLAICLLGGVLSWLVRRRQQRYGLPWTKTWMAFVFLGGLPALVGYYAHRRWPAVEKCPACGRAVPHDREACIGCGSPFPEPAPRGTEVFA